MDQATSPLPPSTIPWQRSWILLICFLAGPWLLLLFSERISQSRDNAFFITAMFWQFAHAMWGFCLSGLVFRRFRLYLAVTILIVLVLVNFVLTYVVSTSPPHEVIKFFFAILILQAIGFTITRSLRESYTIAHHSEIAAAEVQENSQYSLRALFFTTLVLAIIVALLSYGVQSRNIRSANDLIPWLSPIIAALIWNELFQWRLRWLNVVVCSAVWVGLLIWKKVESDSDWLLLSMVTMVIYSIPLAYRWSGWRMVRREWLS